MMSRNNVKTFGFATLATVRMAKSVYGSMTHETPIECKHNNENG